MFFGGAKDPFDGFFAFLVLFFPAKGMPDVLTNIQVVGPDMAGDDFGMVLALGALHEVRTILTDGGIAFVFPIAFPVCRGIREDLVLGAEVTVIACVVNIFPFEEITFFGPWTGIGEVGDDAVINEGFGNGRNFITGIGDQGFGMVSLEPFINVKEGDAVMGISRMEVIS